MYSIDKEIYKLGDYYVAITGAPLLNIGSLTNFFNDIRSIFEDVLIQGIDSSTIYGIDHLMGVLKITLEAAKRNILRAQKLEVDLLMRIACSDQILDALNYTGVKNNSPACFVMISDNKLRVLAAKKEIIERFGNDLSIIMPSRSKYEKICIKADLKGINIRNDTTFVNYLIERANLIIR